jgi:hypothetical protein
MYVRSLQSCPERANSESASRTDSRSHYRLASDMLSFLTSMSL